MKKFHFTSVGESGSSSPPRSNPTTNILFEMSRSHIKNPQIDTTAVIKTMRHYPIRRGRTFLSPNFVKFGYVMNSRKLKTLYFAEIF